MGTTHLLGSAAASLTVAIVSGMHNPVLLGTGLACAAAGSLLPDIDHENAKLSRSNELFHAISCIVCSLTKHRHFCHTLCFAALITVGWALLFGLLGAVAENYVEAFWTELAMSSRMPLFEAIARIELMPYARMGLVYLLVGILSHLLLDTLNPEGIMWLYPVRKQRFHLLSIKTDSVGELLVRAVLVVAAAMEAMFLVMRYGLF